MGTVGSDVWREANRQWDVRRVAICWVWNLYPPSDRDLRLVKVVVVVISYSDVLHPRPSAIPGVHLSIMLLVMVLVVQIVPCCCCCNRLLVRHLLVVVMHGHCGVMLRRHGSNLRRVSRIELGAR